MLSEKTESSKNWMPLGFAGATNHRNSICCFQSSVRWPQQPLEVGESISILKREQLKGGHIAHPKSQEPVSSGVAVSFVCPYSLCGGRNCRLPRHFKDLQPLEHPSGCHVSLYCMRVAQGLLYATLGLILYACSKMGSQTTSGSQSLRHGWPGKMLRLQPVSFFWKYLLCDHLAHPGIC